MNRGIWTIVPGAFFFSYSFLISASSLNFYKTASYFGLIISLWFLLRSLKIFNIIKPVVIGLSVILFFYGVFQKYYIFPKILSNFKQQEGFFSSAIIERIRSGRIFSIFTLPTLYGIICAVLILFLFYFFMENYHNGNKKKIVMISYLLLIIAGLFNLVLTGSFGAIIGLAIGIFIYLLIDRTIDTKYISLIIMIMSLVVLIVIGLRYNEAKNLEPVKLRLTNWNQAVRMIDANPFFGVGIGNYGANVSYYTKGGEARSLYAHNFFLQITAELGIPFVFFIIMLILINRRKIFLSNLNREKTLFLSILAVLIFYNLIDIGLYFFSTGIIFSVVLSQLYPGKLNKKTLNMTLLAICSLVYGLMSVSDNYLIEGDIVLTSKDKIGAEKLYDKSLLLNPLNAGSLLRKALLLNETEKQEKLNLIKRALLVYPEYGEALYNKSLIDLKNGHILSAFYYAGAAHKKNKRNPEYWKLYEFIKKNLPTRNSVKRN